MQGKKYYSFRSIIGFDLYGSTCFISRKIQVMTGAITIPADFTTGLQDLVSQFTASIGNWAPTIILTGLGVVLLFVFWGTIRSWAVRIFSRKGR